MAPRPAIDGPSRGALVLSAALLPLFLHADYQPSLDVGSITLRLTDAAVLAVAAVALAAGRRTGFGRLRAGRWVWLGTAAFFAAIALSMLVAAASDRVYPLGDHLVTAAKYAEYALLALAVPLLVRTRADLHAVVTTVVVLCALATVVGLLQLAGVPLLEEWPAGRRQPSFPGHHDFAALAGAAIAAGWLRLGTAADDLRRRWFLRATWTPLGALTVGVAGLVVSGAITGVAGVVLAAAVALAVLHRLGALDRRWAAAIVASVLVAAAGVVAIRSANIADVFDDETGAVETFSHRGVLAYIGIQEFLGHPLTGVGWQGSLDEAGYGPYLDEARERYPDEPARVFPSPEEPWGVQNAYLQALADLGIVGAAAFVALLAAGLLTGVRAALRTGNAGSPAAVAALTGTLWLCVAMGILNGIGFIAGLPLDALLWLALGLVAAGAAGIAEAGRE